MARAALLLALAMLAGACGEPAGRGPRLYAAASLADVVEDLSRVTDAPPFVAVVGGTSTLARQVELGAPPGVFMAADRAWAEHLVVDGRVEERGAVPLLSSSLVVVVADGVAPPADVTGLGDPRFRRVALADPDAVPAGRYAREALRAAGVWDAVEARMIATADVRAAQALVSRGEVDAALVYRTDALAAGMPAACDVPTASHAEIVYVLLLLRGAPAGSRELWEWLQGDVAGQVFEARGFTRIAR